jgi:hypothetical protein
LHSKYEGSKKKNRIPLGYLLEVMIKTLAIWNFLKIRNLATLGHFFPWKILCIGRNPTFQVEIWRKFASKRNNGFTGRFNYIWLQPKYKSNFFKKRNYFLRYLLEPFIGMWQNFLILWPNYGYWKSLKTLDFRSFYF